MSVIVSVLERCYINKRTPLLFNSNIYEPRINTKLLVTYIKLVTCGSVGLQVVI